MEFPKFLRPYKGALTVLKYIIGIIAFMYLVSLSTYLINTDDTFTCFMGMIMLSIVVITAGTIILDKIKLILNKINQ